MRFAATTIFCEDIRAEVSGTETLVGVMPDNINFVSFPSTIPKLCAYTRLILFADLEYNEVVFSLSSTDGTVLGENPVESDLLARAVTDAKAQGATIANIVARLVFSPMQVKNESRLIASVKVDGESINCGQLNFRKSDGGST